jgi:cytidine deaminase
MPKRKKSTVKKPVRKSVRLSRVEKDLVARALQVRKRAHAPYSGFQVGAALLAEDGRIFEGCNLENASYGATVCAERNAVAQAVSSGQTKFRQIAIATAPSPPSPPCGMCLQVLVEFCDDLSILLANPRGEVERTRLSKLIPRPFSGRIF